MKNYIFLTLACLLSGCVLPYPSRTYTIEGLKGRVLDAQTRDPVPCAKVMVNYAKGPMYDLSENREVMTKASGRFEIPAEHVQHWFYIFGVALNHRWPHPDYFGGPDLPSALTIEHPGYERYSYSFQKVRHETAYPDHPYFTPLVEQKRVYLLTRKGAVP